MSHSSKRKAGRIVKEVCPMTIPLAYDFDELLFEKRKVSETVKKTLKAASYYILHTIIHRSDNRQVKDDFESNGYYRLSSSILNSVCGKRYSEALDFLRDNGIIEVDESYSKGRYSKGYRLSGPYSGETKVREMPEGPIKDRVLKVRTEMVERNNLELRKIPHITKWFDPGMLKINVDAIHDYIEFYRKDLLKYADSQKPEHRDIIKNKTILRYNNSLQAIKRIEEGDFKLSRTGKDRRLHSSITNLKKELRGFLTYDNKPLVGIDIKSSQPYLFTRLLMKESYEESESGLDIHSLYHELHTSIQEGNIKFKINDILMCVDKQKGADNQQVELSFLKVVWTDDFYNDLILAEKKVFCTTDLIFKDRSTVKKLIMIILYSKDPQKKYYPAVIRFKQLFPLEAQLMEIFNEVSTRDDENYLPILLQRLESRIILDIVCKEINNRLPDAPLIPIHDSILTTPEHVEQVKEIMESVILRLTGIPVGLKVDDFSVQKSLDELPQTVEEDYNELNTNLNVEFSVEERRHLIDRMPKLGDRQILSTRYLSDNEETENTLGDLE
ncbi:hypothetical protein [Daejeonella oryzae]|uniref:hypothetical protein n=1 Tax=Daejeonella oryzae TaxID=1122943 RepID=UPI00047D3FAB|nr:hypothetical protein [Daejeonella oryzae]